MATQPVNPRPSHRTHCAVEISTAADGVSEAINITGLCVGSIQMSTAWTDAGIGFQASLDGSTNYYPVYDTLGNHLVYPTSASRVVCFDPSALLGAQRLQLVSKTTAGVAVAQAAARTIVLGLVDSVRNS